ncbi:MAG: hypothetical protein IJZ22_09185, partial [Bacteroidaceae bacterium]|nr:hypothetical protein [Bacteroidaceae bacterium]
MLIDHQGSGTIYCIGAFRPVYWRCFEMFDHSFFDPVYDRAGTGAIKYNNLTQNTIPMWIADMDFKSPPAVT